MEAQTRNDAIIQTLDRKNPHSPHSEAYDQHEIDCAKKMCDFFTQQLCNQAYETWCQQATFAKTVLPPNCRITLYPPPETAPDCAPESKSAHVITKPERSFLSGMAMVHVLRLWHGAKSDIARAYLRRIEGQLEDRMPLIAPKLFHNPLMVIVWAHTCNVDREGALPFAPPAMRNFLTSRCAMLSDFTMVLAFLGEGRSASRVLMYASSFVRRNCAFMVMCVSWLGAPAMRWVHPTLLENPRTRLFLQRAYKRYGRIVAHKDRRLLSHVPPFRTFTNPEVKLVDANAWLANHN